LKRILFILFIILFCSSISKTEIITRDDIQQAGLLRLSDIFLLIDDWDCTTIDGITYQASPLGLNSYQHQDWKIFLNRIPIDIDIFGVKALDRIPVDLSQISLIRIYTEPMIYAGQKTTGGVINIYTKSFKPGFKANFRTGFGNETGDPGPYFYTDQSSPNIDKLGNIIAGGISNYKDSSYIGISYKREIGYPTDQAMFNRNNAIAGGYYPRQKLEAVCLEQARYYSDFFISNIFGISDFEDFYYLRQYGGEIPVKSRLVYFGSTGCIKYSYGRLIRYRFSYSANKPDYRNNSLNLDLNWKQETVRANIEADIGKGRATGIIGLWLNHFAVHSYYLPGENHITEATAYSALNFWFFKNLESNLGLIINFRKNESGFLARYKTLYRFSKNKLLSFVLSYDKTLPEESKSIWYWQKQGYSFLEENGVFYNITGNLKSSNKFTAKVTFGHGIPKRHELEIYAYFRSFSNIYCEGQFLVSDQYYSAPNNLIVNTDCSGQIVGVAVKEKIKLPNKIRIDFFVRYQQSLNNETLFEETWSSVPKFRLSTTIYWNQLENYSFSSRIRYQGKTKWVDYDNTDNAINGIHNVIGVDPFVSIDLTAQKYFNNRKIRTSFSIRNLLNNKIKYHPIGAQFDLSYFAQIEFLLN